MIRLDNLIASLTDSANAAIANRDALVGVLTALALARTRVQVLHEAWQEYSRRDNSWHSFTSNGIVAITSPPGWAQDLNAKAHAVTAELDQTVFEYSQRFVAVEAVASPPRTEFTPLPPEVKATAARGTGNPGTSSKLLSGGRGYRSSRIGTPQRSSTPISAAIREPQAQIDVPATDDRRDTSDIGTLPTQVAAGLGVVGAGIGAAATGSAQRLRPMLGSRAPGLDSSTSRSVQLPAGDADNRTPTPSAADPSSQERLAPVPAQALGSVGPQGHRRARRRGGMKRSWELPAGVPGLIAPATISVVHDPGPYVIGPEN
jgi:hypothetical protein